MPQAFRALGAAPGLPIRLLDAPTETVDILDRVSSTHRALLTFYRGRKSESCRRYLEKVEHRLAKFAARDTAVIAISTDGWADAQRTNEAWQLPNLTLAYDLDVDDATKWGLVVKSRPHEQPFVEPAVYLVSKDRRVLYASLASLPFGRPDLDDLLDSIQEIVDHSRGKAA
ncbi:MAG: redoxin domain-containing protein [Myxococcota bacterium]